MTEEEYEKMCEECEVEEEIAVAEAIARLETKEAE
jgi:hypothetical protein